MEKKHDNDVRLESVDVSTKVQCQMKVRSVNPYIVNRNPILNSIEKSVKS